MAKRKKNNGRGKRSAWRKAFCVLAAAGLAAGLLATLFVVCVYHGVWGKIPDYGELREIRQHEASSLYSEDGELLGKYYLENRTEVLFGSIAPDAVNALVATEDARFYEHHGVDKISLARVMLKTVLLGDKREGGGSTISQQLAKNLYPRELRSRWMLPVVKVKEMIVAHRLESIYTKDEILTLYLNTVWFGEGAYGIESAAQQYFSTTATQLSTTEAATLVGLLKGPSLYNPRLHPERALERRNTVIDRMVEHDYLSEQEGERLKREELGLRYKPANHYSGPAPYLRELIRRDAAEILAAYNERHGTSYNLYTSGLTLTATIDAEMQRYAEEAVREWMRPLQNTFYHHWEGRDPWEGAPETLEKAVRECATYRNLQKRGLSDRQIREAMGKKKRMTVYSAYQGEVETEMSSLDSLKHYLKILHPALVAIDPRTGKVKAWVGGLDFKYFQYDQVLAARQVGSVFKPVVYSAAIERGARLDAYYANERKTYPKYGDWSPRNSDNQYGGYYTLRGALSKSLNTVAVEVMLRTGTERVAEHARRLGIPEELPAVPSLALGVADIPLYDMVRPYLCYANSGVLHTPYYLAEIRDKEGKVIYQAPRKEDGAQVLDANTANVMSALLTAVVTEGTGQRLAREYRLPGNVAGKTGTTQDQTDGWFIGYNPRIVVGVRVGANDPRVHFRTTALGQGANTALPIFGLFMQKCLRSDTYGQWAELSFPMPRAESEEELSVPAYKERLKLMEKLRNDKIDRPQAADSPEVKEKRGFFRRIGNLFKKKDKKQKDDEEN